MKPKITGSLEHPTREFSTHASRLLEQALFMDLLHEWRASFVPVQLPKYRCHRIFVLVAECSI